MNNVYMTKNDNRSSVSYFFYVGKRRRFTYLVFQNLGKHFAEKACWATWPTMLLESVGLKGAWQLIFALFHKNPCNNDAWVIDSVQKNFKKFIIYLHWP